MRILLAIPYFPPAHAFGGSVTVAGTVAAGAVAAGHDVVVATTDVFDEHRRIAAGDPVAVPGARVARFPNLSHRLAAGANGYAPRGLRSWLGREMQGFDVALLQDFYSAVSVLTARAAAAAGVPFALQPLGTVGAGAERGRPLAKRAFLRTFGHRTLREAAALVHATDHERQDFLDVGAPEDRLVRLPLPLELPAARRAEPEEPRVVYVGRLHPLKGIDRLIRAVALVRESVPAVRLDIAGPGSAYQVELERVAAGAGMADAVTFHGFVSAERKFELLRGAQCFGLLSDAEGLPMAALEALACGTPAVLSEGCHIPEVAGRGGLETDGGVEATAAAVRRMLTDADLRASLSEGGRTLAEDFRAEVVLPQVLDLLDRLSR